MTMYVVTVDVDDRTEPAPAEVDRIMDGLATVHPSLGTSPRGWMSVTVSLPAENAAQAVVMAVAVVEAATGRATVAVAAMTERERDASEGFDEMPDTVTTTEAAAILGVSRQAVLDRINRRTLPATKVGRDYAIPRAAVTR